MAKENIISGHEEFSEQLAFLFLLPKEKIGYIFPQNAPIIPDFNQIFASDQDYIFFARSICEQCYLRPSINSATHKLKAG